MGNVETWSILAVEWGSEDVVAERLRRVFTDFGLSAEFLVPKLLVPRKRNGPTLVAVLPGYLFVTPLPPDDFIIRCQGLCSGVNGFVSMAGNKLKPATVNKSTMDEFLKEVEVHNESLKPASKGRPTYVHPDPGSTVKVLDGLVGTMVHSGRHRSVIAAQLLGRLVNVSIGRTQKLERTA